MFGEENVEVNYAFFSEGRGIYMYVCGGDGRIAHRMYVH